MHSVKLKMPNIQERQVRAQHKHVVPATFPFAYVPGATKINKDDITTYMKTIQIRLSEKGKRSIIYKQLNANIHTESDCRKGHCQYYKIFYR